MIVAAGAIVVLVVGDSVVVAACVVVVARVVVGAPVVVVTSAVVVAVVDVAAVDVAAVVTDRLDVDSELHDCTSNAPNRTAHDARRFTMLRRSVERDHHAAVPVRDSLALDDAADLGQELGDLAHEAVLGLDLGADPSSCGPVTKTAVASVGAVPAFTRPRESDGCTMTFDVCASRLALPDPDEVQNPILPSSIAAAHTGVVIGVPSRLNVVSARYFSSARLMAVRLTVGSVE